MTAGILLSFAALATLALFLVHKGVAPSAAPLAAVCGTVLFFTLFGYFGLLYAAGWVYHLAALGLAIYMGVKFFVKKMPLPKLSGGFWFFIVGSLFIIVLFWVRQPMFLNWDEFSTWGTGAKLTKLYNVLYPVAPVGWNWPATQPPAFMNFAYFMQFWGAEFSEWQTYAAYDILQLACLACLALPFSKKQANIAFPLMLAGLLTPYILTLSAGPTKLTAVYLTTYADIPMALLFAAALLYYFGAKQHNWAGMLPLCLCLAALPLTKAPVGVALALVVAAIVFADTLFRKADAPLGAWKRAKPALARLGLCAGSAVAGYASWSLYTSAALGVSSGNLGGGGNIGMLEMPVQFVKDLFSSQQSGHFRLIVYGNGEQPGMLELFFSSKTTLLGSGAVVLGICLAIGLFAAFIAKDKALRRRSILFSVFSSLGFAAYYLFLTMYYIYIFTQSQAFTDYERYVYPYYIGCFLVALLLLGTAAKNSRFVVEGKLAVLLLCALLCFRFVQTVPPVYSLVGFHSSEFDARREQSAEIQAMTQDLEMDSTTFIVSIGPSGDFMWFVYCYEFLPWQVDYSYGGGNEGGNFTTYSKQPDGTVETHFVTADEWQAYLLASECDYVLIDEADDGFRQIYGHLFADGMESYFTEKTNLYTVQAVGQQVQLVPFVP